MARETGIQEVNPNETRRQLHTFLNAEAFLATAALNHFATDNITGAVVWVKATSVLGTPAYTLSLESSPDETDANFVDVAAMVRPDVSEIADENPHVYMFNFANCHQFTRFKLTLGAGDGGDDLVTFKVCFLYGSFTNASDVTLETGDLEIGAVEIKDATTDTRLKVMAEDSAHSSGDTGIMLMAVRNDSGTALAGNSGDYIPITTDANGNVRVATGSGGSAGGGNNTYSTEQGDFTATPMNGTYSIVLSVDSIGGVAITAANLANGILKIMDVSLTPDEYKTVTLDKFTWTAATKTIDITNCTGAFTLGTGDVVSLTLTGPDKMRDSSTDAQRTSAIRDMSDQYVSETLIDTTNVAAATNYYPSSSGVSMDGYKNLSIQGLTSGGVTTTIEVTNDDAASPDWFDITTHLYDWVSAAYAASYVDVNMLFFLENLNVKALRIKSVTSDATNAVQYNLRRIY